MFELTNNEIISMLAVVLSYTENGVDFEHARKIVDFISCSGDCDGCGNVKNTNKRMYAPQETDF